MFSLSLISIKYKFLNDIENWATVARALSLINLIIVVKWKHVAAEIHLLRINVHAVH